MSFFDEYNIVTEIFTIWQWECEKESVITYGQKRSFHALSIRVAGDADIFTDQFSDSLKVGDILFMPEFTEYHRNSNTSEQLIVIHFATLHPVSLPDSFHPDDRELFLKYFQKLLNVWTRKNDGYFYEAMALLNTLLRDIMWQKRATALAANSNQALLQPAVEYINKNFTDNGFTVEDLAGSCNISSSYFRRIFHNVYGISPIDYIINKRITYATELLGTNFYSVKQVAEKCGIPNSKYFSTLYKRKTGKSPSEQHLL